MQNNHQTTTKLFNNTYFYLHPPVILLWTIYRISSMMWHVRDVIMILRHSDQQTNRHHNPLCTVHTIYFLHLSTDWLYNNGCSRQFRRTHGWHSHHRGKFCLICHFVCLSVCKFVWGIVCRLYLLTTTVWYWVSDYTIFKTNISLKWLFDYQNCTKPINLVHKSYCSQ